MERIVLGKTGLRVTPIAYGTWQFGGDWGAVDEDAAVGAIRRALELGVNFFDTAQSYGFGVSERILGRGLADRLRTDRDELVIATKGGLRIDERDGLVRDSSPAWLLRGVEESLVNLGVERIDLYQVHWPDSKVPLAETGLALRELIEVGKIGHVGVSNFSVAQMEELAETLPVETIQPPYHLFNRGIEEDVLPYTQEQDIGVLVYGPLAHGLLGGAMDGGATFAEGDWRGRSAEFQGEVFANNLEVVHRLSALASEMDVAVSQLAIAWTLAHPAVHASIVGARRIEHLEESVAAAQLRLEDDELRQIGEIMSDAVPLTGPSPETV